MMADVRPVRGTAGFTLIELIAVMAIGAILATVVWRNLATPLRGFADVNRRAALVATANLAALRISRELRLALPNSVRVNADGSALEFLQTTGIGRYRRESDPGARSLAHQRPLRRARAVAAVELGDCRHGRRRGLHAWRG